MARRLAAAVAVLAALVVVTVALAGTSSRGQPDPAGRATKARARASRPSAASPAAASPGQTVAAISLGPTITIGAPLGPSVKPGFLGFSFEFQAVRVYTGSDPHAVDPVLVQLIRNLTPNQAPVLRIGGDSTDVSWVPTHGVTAPSYVSYRLTPSWLATTSALTRLLGARMIMGLNLAADEPALAGAEARAFVRSFGTKAITALEIGNEPNVYAGIKLFHTVLGVPFYARPRGYSYPTFRHEFAAEAAAAPRLPLAGPALAVGPKPKRGSWVRVLPDFLTRNPRMPIMTIHRYPLQNCFVPPRSPQYPSIAHLLAGYATTAMANGIRTWIQIAHSHHRLLRVDELNSAACRGKSGVSDVFASSLWVIDALFSLVRAGVDGVNLHTLPKSGYQLFTFNHPGGRWTGSVKPVYYGLQLFAQAAPPGSRLLALRGLGGTPALSAWATQARDGTVRVVLINKSTTTSRVVNLRPGAGAGAVTIESLQAPSILARTGIRLGGRTYGASTGTGALGPLRSRTVPPRGLGYRVTVPRASAALVTFAH